MTIFYNNKTNLIPYLCSVITPIQVIVFVCVLQFKPHSMPRTDISKKVWIDIHNEEEVLFFSKRFHTTPKELVDTVRKIGKTVKYVQLHFDRQAMDK